MKNRLSNIRKEKSRQHTFYFPSLITGLLERCGVKSKKKDKWLADSKPHTIELELRIWESRGGKDNPCEEAKTKVVELKAIREAQRCISRKNKFASPTVIPVPESVQETTPGIDIGGERSRSQADLDRTELEQIKNVLVDRRVEKQIS